jgi:hypothetical protein
MKNAMNECCYVHFSLHMLLEASLENFSKIICVVDYIMNAFYFTSIIGSKLRNF